MRRLPVLPLAFSAVLLLASCLPGKPTPTATANPSTGTEVILPTSTVTSQPLGVDAQSLQGLSIQAWHTFDGPELTFLEQQTDQFNATNEWGIQVHLAAYGDYPTLFDSINSAADSGSLPELAVALPEQMLAWNSAGLVADLDPYLREPTYGLGEDAINDIPPIFLAQDTYDGQLLGLPAQRSARFLFYNRTWAQELGFTNPPRTADEFRQQACAANAFYRTDDSYANDGYGGWIVDTRWQTTTSWLLSFGGSVTDGRNYTFNNTQNLAALQFLKTLFDDHCAWLSTEPNPLDSFARRSALFISGDLAEARLEINSMQRLENSDEWMLIPFPGTQEQTVVVYGPSYTVFKSSPEKQLAAWLYARWMLRAENQAQWVEADGTLPLRSSLLDMIGPFRASLPEWDAAVSALPLGHTIPQLASWRTVRYVLEDGWTAVFQDNTPVEQLESVLSEMDDLGAELNNQ